MRNRAVGAAGGVLPVLVPLGMVLSATMAWRYRMDVDRVLMLGVVLPGMLHGTVTGFGLRHWPDGAILKQLRGLIIVWFAVDR